MRLGEEIRDKGSRRMSPHGDGRFESRGGGVCSNVRSISDFPELLVLDSTHPMAVLGVRTNE